MATLQEIKKLKRIISKIIKEAVEPIDGDAPGPKQLHVFDFDDTLGVTADSNGVMLYKDGEPAWKTAEEAEDWIENVAKLSGSDLLKGPGGATFEKPKGIKGFAAYISSGALPSTKEAAIAAGQEIAYAPKKPTKDGIALDFSPSASAKQATPIKSTIDKVKKANAAGARTAIVTARSGEKTSGVTKKDFAGNDIEVSVEDDLTKFMGKQGAQLSKGVYGLSGQPKGDFIRDHLLDPMPDEIHFYDDDNANIQKVKDSLAGKVPAELFLYGPGKYQDGHDPDTADQAFAPAEAPATDTKKKTEGIDLDRWLLLAGLRR